MQIVLFEDKHIDQLYPITLTRAGFEISCGGINLYNLVKRYFKTTKISCLVRKYLEGVVGLRCPIVKLKGQDFLFINASLVPSIKSLEEIKAKLLSPGAILENEGRIVGARVLGKTKGDNIDELFGEFQGESKKTKLKLFNYPWEVIEANKEIITSNIEFLAEGKKEYKKGVFVGKKVLANDNVVFDASGGPIFIDDGVEINPFVNIEGPVYIGKKSKIKTFADIKDGVTIGEVCKVGGEVEASVIESYSNKQHMGFLGHAYLGSWINIGGGTSNSDLKNTYGNIKMSVRRDKGADKADRARGQEGFSEKIDTGLQFLGCVIGDYSKTGINTSILTGKIIGVNANVLGMVKKDVPSFTNLTPAGKFEYILEQGLKVQKRMFDRRGVKQTAGHKKMMKDVFEMTVDERKDMGVKKGEIKV